MLTHEVGNVYRVAREPLYNGAFTNQSAAYRFRDYNCIFLEILVPRPWLERVTSAPRTRNILQGVPACARLRGQQFFSLFPAIPVFFFFFFSLAKHWKFCRSVKYFGTNNGARAFIIRILSMETEDACPRRKKEFTDRGKTTRRGTERMQSGGKRGRRTKWAWN